MLSPALHRNCQCQGTTATRAHAVLEEPVEDVAPWEHAAQPAPRVPEELPMPQVLPAPEVLVVPGPEPMRTPPGLLLSSMLLSLCSYSLPD